MGKKISGLQVDKFVEFFFKGVGEKMTRIHTPIKARLLYVTFLDTS